jgi:hypothetical protein
MRKILKLVAVGAVAVVFMGQQDPCNTNNGGGKDTGLDDQSPSQSQGSQQRTPAEDTTFLWERLEEPRDDQGHRRRRPEMD